MAETLADKISQMYEKEIEPYMTGPVPWEGLAGKTILVVGANGVIGAAIVRLLLHRNRCQAGGMRILAVSRSRERFMECFAGQYEKGELFYYSMDISEKVQLPERADYVICAAGDGDPASFAVHPVEVMRTNLAGLDHLLCYSRQCGCGRVLYLSSGEIYGQSVEGKIFDETFCGYVDHAKARSCYPAAKRAAEVLCQSWIQEYGADIVIARPCHIFGPDLKAADSRAVAQFLFQAACGRELVMKSDGRQQRSMCYSFDCAEALLMILLFGKRGEAYNIAGKEQVVSIRQLAEMIADAGKVGFRIETPTQSEKSSYNPVEKSILDWHKLYALGWRPRKSIREGIHSTLEIMKERVG
ncbi:MAG: NAD(P)-dependent oxidoreductase [Lachnospiraceae bacterium]|nr:NAD(P)-dependent oxidoreductase [Lachnospiraceae bacterium]